MSNLQKAVVIGTTVLGDGSNAVFTLDLLNDFYWADSGSTTGLDILNWFSQNANANRPVGVYAADSSPDTVSLSGTVITYTFASAPAVGKQSVEITLLF
jgi:hypothetical protein